MKHGVTEQELEVAKAELLKQGVSGLDNEKVIHEYMAADLKFNDDLYLLLNRYKDIASLKKEDVNTVIKKYIRMDRLVEVMADQYGTRTQ